MKKASASKQKALVRGESEYGESRLKHSDPNYTPPVYPDPPPPYSGKDYYRQVVEAVKAIADEFGLYTVERTAGDQVQKGLKWRIVQIQAHSPHEHKDVEPIAMLLFRASQPAPREWVDSSVDMVIAQIERNYVQGNHSAA